VIIYTNKKKLLHNNKQLGAKTGDKEDVKWSEILFCLLSGLGCTFFCRCVVAVILNCSSCCFCLGNLGKKTQQCKEDEG